MIAAGFGAGSKVIEAHFVRVTWLPETLLNALATAPPCLEELHIKGSFGYLTMPLFPPPPRPKPLLPLAQLDMLVAATSVIERIRSAFHMDSQAICAEPDVSGHNGKPFYDDRELSVTQLEITVPRDSPPSLLPIALEMLSVNGSIDDDFMRMIAALPKLRILRIDDPAEVSVLKRLPKSLKEFGLCLHNVRDAADAVYALQVIEEASDLELVELSFEHDERFPQFTRRILSSQADYSAILARLDQAVEHLRQRFPRVKVDYEDIDTFVRTCQKQWPYSYGLYDETSRRLIMPNQPSELRYALRLFCTAAHVYGGILPYLFQLGDLPTIIATDASVTKDVAKRLLQALTAHGFLERDYDFAEVVHNIQAMPGTE